MKNLFDQQKKRTNTYIGLVSGVLLGMLLTACMSVSANAGIDVDTNAMGADTDMDIPFYETSHISIPKLNPYLIEYESEYPYICADIMVSGYSAEKPEDDYLYRNVTFAGEADVNWQFYDSLPKLEEGVQARRENMDEEPVSDGGADAGLTFRMLYYRFPLPKGAHALDIYEVLKERYDTEEHPLCAYSGGHGTNYKIIQNTIGDDGYTYSYPNESEINFTVKDGIAYGLILMEPEEIRADESIRLLFFNYNDNINGEISGWGWGLDEEVLYWIDHEERITVMEDGRSFVEVQGINTCEPRGGFLEYFGMLKDADYEVAISEGEPPLSIHFALDVQYSLKGEYACYLLNGDCADERFNMTVTDPESGSRLQALWVELCVEAIDTVTFVDLNADGCLDMRIDKPTHWNGEGAVMDAYAGCDYLLWNPEERIFERKSADEVQNSLLSNQNGGTENDNTGQAGEDIEYVVQSGDCLWSISERLLGAGYLWTMIKRAEDAPKDPNYLLPGEVVIIPQERYLPN